MSASNMRSSVASRRGAPLTQASRRTVGARRNLMVRAGAERVKNSKDEIVVSPSILSANFASLGEQVRFCFAVAHQMREHHVAGAPPLVSHAVLVSRISSHTLV